MSPTGRRIYVDIETFDNLGRWSPSVVAQTSPGINMQQFPPKGKIQSSLSIDVALASHGIQCFLTRGIEITIDMRLCAIARKNTQHGHKNAWNSQSLRSYTNRVLDAADVQPGFKNRKIRKLKSVYAEMLKLRIRGFDNK